MTTTPWEASDITAPDDGPLVTVAAAPPTVRVEEPITIPLPASTVMEDEGPSPNTTATFAVEAAGWGAASISDACKTEAIMPPTFSAELGSGEMIVSACPSADMIMSPMFLVDGVVEALVWVEPRPVCCADSLGTAPEAWLGGARF